MIIYENKLTLFPEEFSLFGDLLYNSKGYFNCDILALIPNSEEDCFTIFFKNETLATEYWQVFCSLSKEMNIL